MAMTEWRGVAAEIARELDRLEADVVHVGLFDLAAMFRERRLRRQELLSTADTAVFANVLPKWDSADQILAPGPYGSETIAYDPASIRPYPFEPRAAALVADYTGPQADLMPRRVLARQVARAQAAGHEAVAAGRGHAGVVGAGAAVSTFRGARGAAAVAAEPEPHVLEPDPNLGSVAGRAGQPGRHGTPDRQPRAPAASPARPRRDARGR